MMREAKKANYNHGDAGCEEASDEDGYEESGTSAHTGGCAGSEGVSVVV